MRRAPPPGATSTTPTSPPSACLPLLKAAVAVDSAAVAATAIEHGLARPAIGELVRAARTQAMADTVPSGL